MTQWSDDRVERLKSLWQEGLSASQVAHALGDTTRNAVIGKVHRLGLADRDGPRRVCRPRPAARRRPTNPSHEQILTVVEEEPLKLDDGSFVTMRTVDRSMCRWPLGDPASNTFHLCGRSPKPGSPYCEAHSVKAHQPHRKRRGDRALADRHIYDRGLARPANSER
jgi:GcrA cell cycle regulator